jgi:hypothetical protein
MIHLALFPKQKSTKIPNLLNNYKEGWWVEIVLFLPTIAHEKHEEYKHTYHVHHKHNLPKEYR